MLARYRLTVAVFVLSGLLHAALIPLTYGQDFAVWRLAAQYTLSGVDIYAHHPPYPGGPYAYIPLFLYLELPMQWLTLHTGVSFTVLGKLPIALADLLVGALLVRRLHREGRGDRTLALGSALYLLNPLVLYNSAFYGRFDSVCVALLLLALESSHQRSEAPGAWRRYLLYALAVAAKSYPIFLLPWFWRRDPQGRRRLLAALLLVLGGLTLPYLLTSPLRLIADLVLYDGQKLPVHLSWQVLFLGVLPPPLSVALSFVALVLFGGLLLRLTWLDCERYALVAILLFIVLSKVVIEQYFLWPLPFLILRALVNGDNGAAALLVMLTSAGMVANAYLHPFGDPAPLLDVAVAVATVAYLASLLRRATQTTVSAVSSTRPGVP